VSVGRVCHRTWAYHLAARFAVAAVVLVIGLLAVRWVLVAGGLLFIAAAGGWFADVGRQWRQVGHSQQPGPRRPPDGEPTPREEAT